jgi:cytidylate kinase
MHVNYTLRSIAREKGVPLARMQELALREFPRYDLRIERKQCDFAARSRACVVASRLAVWLDDSRVWRRCGALRPPSFDVKAWLDVPLKVRARRRARDDRMPFRDSLAFTRRRDVENALRYKRLYGVDVKKIPRDCVVIDGERNNAKQVADAIVKLAREKAGKTGKESKTGFAVKKKVKSRRGKKTSFKRRKAKSLKKKFGKRRSSR